ncbi:hypothetical protein ACP3V5_08920 [Vibrio maritimus]
MYIKHQTTHDLYIKSVNNEVDSLVKDDLAEIEQLKRDRVRFGKRFDWLMFWFNPVFSIGLGLLLTNSFLVGFLICIVPYVLIHFIDHSKSEKEAFYKKVDERIALLESAIEKQRAEVVALRNLRPQGMRHFDTPIYERLISGVKTKATTTTVGGSFVYHIATDNMLLDEGYIGVTKDFLRREREHFTELYNGTHQNIKLQSAFTVYGRELKMRVLHSNISEQESYNLENRYRPAANIGLNIRQGGI